MSSGASTPVDTSVGGNVKEKLMPQGFVPEFNPKKESWGEYKERMEIVCEIHEIKNNGLKRNLLLTSLPPEVYRKLRTSLAPMKPVSVTYEKIVEVLDKLLEPVESLLLNRLVSLSLKQDSEESVTQYCERVKESVSKYGLDNSSTAKDMMLTLCFVNGLKEGEYKRSAIQQHRIKTNSTFEETLNAVASAELIQNSEKSNGIFKVESKSEHCYCCGGKNHLKFKCKFRKEKCKNCDKIGHLARVCRSKKRSKKDKKIDNIESDNDETVDDSDDQVYQICEIDDNEENAKIIALINNMRVKMLLDTGACKTIINEKIWREIGEPKIKRRINALKTFSGEIIKVIGECKGRIKISGKEGIFDILVVKGKCKNLLGRNVIDGMKVDLNKLYFKNEVKEKRNTGVVIIEAAPLDMNKTKEETKRDKIPKKVVSCLKTRGENRMSKEAKLYGKFKTAYKHLCLEGENKEGAVRIFLKRCRGVPSIVTGKSPVEIMCGRKQLFFTQSGKAKKEKVKDKNVMVKTKIDSKWKLGVLKSKAGVNLCKIIVEGEEQLGHVDQIRKRRMIYTPWKRS
uniref:CCHC-type domain-containing protein n=1 Tax=Strongyloides papillosus TaxID=174720 RepID=A0A0N5BG22_STREA